MLLVLSQLVCQSAFLILEVTKLLVSNLFVAFVSAYFGYVLIGVLLLYGQVFFLGQAVFFQLLEYSFLLADCGRNRRARSLLLPFLLFQRCQGLAKVC